jgi:hypothetical protein
MKFLLIFSIGVLLNSYEKQNKLIQGSWKLHSVSGRKGFSESDRKMNDLINEGFYTTVATFHEDSTCLIQFYEIDSLVQEEKAKYWLTDDSKYLNSVRKGEKFFSKIFLLSSDTLRLWALGGEKVTTYLKIKE